MKRNHLLILDQGFQSARWLGQLFSKVEVLKQVTQITAESVLVFEGGVDISPLLYNDTYGKWTQNTNWMRDAVEQQAYQTAMMKGAACLGICRGAQLITALNKGKLIQHVTNHEGGHHIMCKDGVTRYTTSHHHQMMYPFDLDANRYEILAWSNQPMSTMYLDGKNRNILVPEVEPEIVMYPFSKSLCIQGHPEWADPRSSFIEYCLELVQQRLIGEA